MPLPPHIDEKFVRAYEQVSPHDPQRPPEEVLARATVAHVSLTEGLVLGMLEAQTQLATATNASNTRLERWSKVQSIVAVVLACFTLAQVIVAVLEYLKPN